MASVASVRQPIVDFRKTHNLTIRAQYSAGSSLDRFASTSSDLGSLAESSASSTPLTVTPRASETANHRFALTDCSSPGHLPPNVLQRVLLHASLEDFKNLHQVNQAWRGAVCDGLRSVAPATCSPIMLKRFPGVEVMGLEDIRFTEPSLAAMTRLRTLVLHHCAFDHNMADLTSLTALDRLKLREVRAAGGQADMDAFLAQLTLLTTLEVTRVSGHRTLPNLCSLSTLRQLQELVISDAHHRERMTSLTQLSALSKLSKLSLIKVRVDCHVVSALSGLTNLRTLEIPDCYRVTDVAMPCLSPLAGLTRLDMRSTNNRREQDLSDAGISSLATMTGLQFLNLAGHKDLTSAGLDFLSSFTRLTELCLAGVSLWTGGAPFLSAMKDLTTLNLARTHLAAEHLCVLGSLSKLTALNISESLIGDDAASVIAKMNILESLDVSYSPMTSSGLIKIAAGCPALTYINIDGCWISTLCMLGVVRRRPLLRLWKKGNSSLPQWMYKIDAVLVAQTQPYTRRLRVLHQGEGSFLMTLTVLLGVLAFFLFYFTFLFVVFTAVFLFPLCMLGVMCLLVGLFAASARLTSGTARFFFSCLSGLGNLCFTTESTSFAAPPQNRVADLV